MSPHKPSEICHEAGVNFVKAMNKILNNPEKKGEEKEYSHFIKTCDKHIENLDSKKIMLQKE